MNKIKLTIALGTGLALGAVASPAALADGMSTAPVGYVAPTIQTLPTGQASADQFNSLFTPVSPVQTSSIDFIGSAGAGTIKSEVFQGPKDATGQQLFAYAYQLSTNNVTNAQGEPVHIDGASWQFNATPVSAGLPGATPNYAYTISDKAVGGLAAPTAADGMNVRTPASLSWEAGQKVGSIRANFVDPTGKTGPLAPGDTSATFVILSHQPFSGNLQSVGALSSNTQTGEPVVYSATGGAISPVPVPEPATFLAWAGMAGAAVLVRRVRKARNA